MNSNIEGLPLPSVTIYPITGCLHVCLFCVVRVAVPLTVCGEVDVSPFGKLSYEII